MKSRPKLHQNPVRRIPVHELFPPPEQGRIHYNPQSARTQSAKLPTHSPSMPMPMHTPRPTHAQRAQVAPRAQRIRRRLPAQNIMMALAFLGLVLCGFGLFGYFRRADSSAPYVLLEVRALEESGHPVTAADVVVNDKKMGVTDSFGEWRRYLQLHAGDKVKISLDKKGSLSGSRQVEVPKAKAEKQDIEVQVAITMTNPKASVKAIAKVAPKVMETRALPEMEEHAKDIERFDIKEASNDKAAIDNGMSDANDSSLGIYFDDGLNRINVVSSPVQAKAGNLMDKRQQDVVKERIIPVLVNDLQSLGLAVDKKSPWKLALSYISNGEQVGYIRAEIEWHSPFGETEKSSFIAGFAKTYEETGRAISSLLRLHMKKTYWAFKENGNWFIDETGQTKDFWRLKAGSLLIDTSGEKFPIAMSAQNDNTRRWKMKNGKTQPCEAVRQRSRCMVSTESLKEAPPLPGWALKRVRILGVVPGNADIYVAGFQAHPVGGNQWEFWSHSGSNLKALVLANGRIVHSESFVDAPGEAVILKMAGAAPKTKIR